MPTTLWSVWEKTVAHQPSAVAFVDAGSGASMTRLELQALALRCAQTAPGDLIPGETVAFAEKNDSDWLKSFLAGQYLGTVALPLDPSLPPSQQAATAEALGAHWFIEPSGQWRRLSSRFPPLPDDHCLLKTTSGSTGEPRALAFTSANMLADGRQIAATMQIGPDDLNLGAIPFGHSYGLGNLIIPLLEQGTTLIGSVEILPAALAAQAARFGATVLPSVPAVLRALAESTVDPVQLRSLRRIVSAGAPLRPEVAAAFHERFDLPIRNFYGSSETGGIGFDRTGEATLGGHSVGRPLDGVSIQLDPTGHVTVASAAVVAPGEHTLADIGRWTAAGELALTGRATPLANIGGKKISPSEIERALRGLEGVSDAWVGVQTRAAGGGDFLLAAVETRKTSAEIRHALAERLPLWQVPRRLWVVPHLPRTVRGKLDRQELEARCLVEPTPS